MTSSSAVVEIIDLTDNTQNIPESETREADADPEKNTTRAARKRKNGEASTTSRVRSSNPVESRRVSVERERDRVQPGEGTESQPAEDTQGKDGESTRKKKRHSKKNKDKDKDKDSGPSSRGEDTQRDALLALDDDRLFFVDTEPASVSAGMAFVPNDDAKAAQSSSRTSEVDEVPLLLPAHVSVLDTGGDLPVQSVQAADSDSDTESYIEYLDYDDRLAPDMVRYFQAPGEEQKQARFVCKRCGTESEHRTNECPVLICLTCGARDEHSTRSCPISKTCFTCGMKGHINRNCPNRHARSRGMANNYDDCDRCGSNEHQTNQCPTIWRLYEYVTDPEREAILRHRESKQSLALGQGGEGYIASDEWCHNCGNTGHLGDDCQELPHPHDAPSTPSAFGLYNILAGPFSDASIGPMRARGPRDWENDEAFGDGWGASAPINVGKRARNKDRFRMEQRALELQEQERDDPADWFENARNKRSNHHNNNKRSGGSRNANANANARHDGGPRGRGRSRSRSRSPSPGGDGGGRGKKDAKIRLGRAWKSDDPPLPPHRKPSLLERVSMKDDDDNVIVDSRSRRHGQHSPSRGRDRERNNGDRDRDREYDRDRGSRERSRDHDRDWEWDRDRNPRGSGGGGGSGGSSRLDGDGIGFRIRGSASRTKSDASRHADSEVYYEREGRRRDEAAESRNGNRRREDSRSRDRKYESRTSRDDDRGPGGPRYKGGYTR